MSKNRIPIFTRNAWPSYIPIANRLPVRQTKHLRHGRKVLWYAFVFTPCGAVVWNGQRRRHSNRGV